MADENEKKLHELDLARVDHDGRIKRLEEQDKHFVTKDQFTPVRMIVYGIATLALGGVGSGLVALVTTAAKAAH